MICREIKNIYIIGICGVATGSLAGMFKEAGFTVSGSDAHIYPPMSEKLREWGVSVHEGFSACNVGSPDLVVIGNAVSRGNPEVEHVLNRRIPYMSMPQALREFFFHDKEVVAVAGTHGKTTTTSLLAHILETAGMSPSFLVGGVCANYGTNYRLGSGKHFIIEGDEYDSSFFEKIPKFILYRPRHVVLTSLEFDHADIYTDLDELCLWFKRLVNLIPSEGFVLYSSEYPLLGGICDEGRGRTYSWGVEQGDFVYGKGNTVNGMTEISLEGNSFGPVSVQSGLFGDFNYSNIAAAAAAALLLGVPAEVIPQAVETFTGVRRRQEMIYSDGRLRIFEDFAHHPTAVKAVLDAVRERFPEARLWAAYEPRSATSRRNVFQNELPGSFVSADTVYIRRPYKSEAIIEKDRLDAGSVVQDLVVSGKTAHLAETGDEIIRGIFDAIDREKENIIIIMSNGGFDGIYRKIVDMASGENT